VKLYNYEKKIYNRNDNIGIIDIRQYG